MKPQLESWVRANGSEVRKEGDISVLQLRPVLENQDKENKVAYWLLFVIQGVPRGLSDIWRNERICHSN